MFRSEVEQERHPPRPQFADGRPALCVSLHDVAPATWPACLSLLHAVRQVADIPLTWLVVPRFHEPGPGAVRDAGGDGYHGAFEAALDAMLARGHELALHGYTHRDDGPPAQSLRERWLRGVFTQGEGEFAALTQAEASRRIALGLAWCAARGWRPAGFVAPAWLLGEAAWRALREYPFLYTTTYQRFYTLPERRWWRSPSLVYAARNRSGRLLSPPAVDLLAAALRGAPLVRLALHPRDAAHPNLVHHAQRLIERLLLQREPVTKSAVAARLGGRLTRDPRSLRTTSGGVHSPHSTRCCSAGSLPWR